jgi:hypothetical protein
MVVLLLFLGFFFIAFDRVVTGDCFCTISLVKVLDGVRTRLFDGEESFFLLYTSFEQPPATFPPSHPSSYFWSRLSMSKSLLIVAIEVDHQLLSP